MSLQATEFLRRFAMHILPPGYMKIRHYGIMSSRAKKGDLESARISLQCMAPASVKHLEWMELFERIFGRHPLLCPKCKKALLETVTIFEPSARGSPAAAIRLNADFDLK